MTFLDDNGQPPVAIHYAANGRKHCHTCTGLIYGIIADNKVVDAELAFLATWLADHEQYCHLPPMRELVQAIEQLNVDGQGCEQARASFLETLGHIVGFLPQDTGAAGGLATRYGLDNPDEVQFRDRVFCFTGNYRAGKRKLCEARIEALGGQGARQVTKKVDYLVVGVIASRDWSEVCMGEKFKKAHGYREQGVPIKIISEELWSLHLECECSATEDA